jgi:hypothetical protein
MAVFVIRWIASAAMSEGPTSTVAITPDNSRGSRKPRQDTAQIPLVTGDQAASAQTRMALRNAESCVRLARLPNGTNWALAIYAIKPHSDAP